VGEEPFFAASLTFHQDYARSVYAPHRARGMGDARRRNLIDARVIFQLSERARRKSRMNMAREIVAGGRYR